MTAADLATIKARVETALAASVKALGSTSKPAKAPTNFHFPMDRVWALGNLDDTRVILTDRAVHAMGAGTFTVAVDDSGVTIAVAGQPTPAPTPSPAPVPPPTPATPEPTPATPHS